MENKNFEIGKWYEIGNPPEKFINIIKVAKIYSNNRVKCHPGSFNIKASDNSSLGWTHNEGEFTDITTIRAVTQEELIKYLPKDHPDLINFENYEIY